MNGYTMYKSLNEYAAKNYVGNTRYFLIVTTEDGSLIKPYGSFLDAIMALYDVRYHDGNIGCYFACVYHRTRILTHKAGYCFR